ncbi:unnamed protein product [Clonostachys chloroleuca]|uniref:Cytochrome P450 n=1 Tax=Clonostachys chloroleuca TaxID=1926264 RepID=A0AA35Q503_9HYPO|nr:unnamed protein product [Clonostachys chloroleuca]
MALLLKLVYAFGLYVALASVYSLCRLVQNYRIARRVGVPIRFVPIDHNNRLWLVVDRKVAWLLRRWLPFGLGDNNLTRFDWRGWEFEDKYKEHLLLGDAFMHVSPGKNWLYVCNPDSVLDILRRSRDFPRPMEIYELLNFFGPNLATVEGQQWKNQRRMAMSYFNEANNEMVWHETVSLASDALHSWASKPFVTSTADDTRTITLHVLSKAAHGKSNKFYSRDDQEDVNPETNYKEALRIVLDNTMLIAALGRKFLAKNWLPRALKKVNTACEAFQRHLTEAYEDEKQALICGRSSSKSTYMASLIHASQDEATGSTGGLTEDEIYGNMYIFSFAGHDSTTHTLTFALMLMAVNPDVQDWISAEVRHVFGEQDPSNWNYGTGFPRLHRCMATMLETARLFTPVPIVKSTGKGATSLKVGDKIIAVPADTHIILNYAALHTLPRIWGEDSLAWRPARWIQGSPNGEFDKEQVVWPQRGAFIAWSEGQRSCPGRKFSQVEFVGTMAALFKDWRVEPLTMAGERIEAARRRLMHQISTDSAQILLLQMLHPEKAPLVWKKRDAGVSNDPSMVPKV